MAEHATRGSHATGDPFPTERLMALVKRLPRYVRLAWRLGRDPGLSRGRRVAVMGAAAYLASPIDLVPGIISVAGQLDDAAVGLLALRFALRGLPQDAQLAHLTAADVSLADIESDLATVRHTTSWIVRSGGRLTARAGKATLRGGFRGARGLVRGVRALRQRGAQ